MSPRPLLDADERRAPRALVERALLLVGRIHRGEVDAAQAARLELARWRERSPAHAEAAATAQLIWNATAADGLRQQVPLPPSAAQSRRRRRMTGALGAAGLAVLSGLGAHWYSRQPQIRLALRTGHAQTLAHALPDGGAIDLAANTELLIAYYGDRRIVTLSRGEARLEVSPDPDRPFTVQTRWGRVRVLGTVFAVAAYDRHMLVAVAQGQVAVWPGGTGLGAGSSTASVTLQAGQAVLADDQGLGQPEPVDPGDLAPWRQGWLIFRNTPLPEAVARWNDYLAQPLTLAEAARLQTLRVTGSYPLNQPQAFIDSLPAMLPVRVHRGAAGGAEIRPR